MPGKVLDLNAIIASIGEGRHSLAVAISAKFLELDTYRQTWLNQRKELRNYLFATDTTTTSNKSLPWKNSTTVPKLTQIRDNLHANYMSALFPHEDWLTWEGDDEKDELANKRNAIESYMRTKLRQDNAEIQFSRLLLDYIDDGNVFSTAEWIDESVENAQTGEITRGYIGPRVVRISPYDIVFNPTVQNFQDSPKIVRSIKTIGDLVKEAKDMPPDSIERKLLSAALGNSVQVRRQVQGMSRGQTLKSDGYQMDGFSSIRNYYQTDYVELLTFYGDLYDIQNDELCENAVITIMDRSYLVDKRQNPNWVVGGGIFHSAWRSRPDNLYGMGPLDNLVGMQYRIDHLENLKADVFDMIAWPQKKIKGYVEDFKDEPGSRIYCGDDGDVTNLHPDATALNADMQIAELERRMEELAGAPREAMGVRTPGEKTKFEVQILDNASSRIFMNKITHFEKTHLQPQLNFMLQLSRRNMSSSDVTRTLDSDIDAIIFSTVTKDDIIANGILRPQGASHFAHQANQLQNLIQLLNSNVGKDPAVAVHLSGKKIAKLLEQLGEFKRFGLYGENIRIIEQGETQAMMAQIQEKTQVQAATPPGITEPDQQR